MLLESIRLVIYCRICVEFSVGISDVEFSDTLLLNLLHKIRHRKICVGIVVSNVDRIRVPTVDDQPLYKVCSLSNLPRIVHYVLSTKSAQ